MRLRGYQASDLDSMHALDVVCFDAPFRFSREAMRRFAEAKKARVVLAEEDQLIAGFAIWHLEGSGKERIGYIVTLDVAPEFRRRGVARLLMGEAERRAADEGCTAMVLHVFVENEAAMSFYAAGGFVQSHRDEAFYGRGRDAWVLHKLLVGVADKS